MVLIKRKKKKKEREVKWFGGSSQEDGRATGKCSEFETTWFVQEKKANSLMDCA